MSSPHWPLVVLVQGPGWQNRARLTDEMMVSLMELPGTKGMFDLRSRASALSAWKMALHKG